MKRRELLQYLHRHGCVVVDEGAKHTKVVSLADSRRHSTVPRHTEIADLLARKICKQLGLPDPKYL